MSQRSEQPAARRSFVKRRGHGTLFSLFKKGGHRTLFVCPKQTVLARRPARFVRPIDLVAQTIFCRLRRAKPRRPAQARTTPGRPAPRAGAGTLTSTGPVLPFGARTS